MRAIRLRKQAVRRVPVKLISNSCRIAQRIDLVNRTRALCGHQLPEGVEWPRFEDGELVEIGDAYEKGNGRAGTVTNLFFRAYDGVPTWVIGKGGGKLFVKHGERVKRPRTPSTTRRQRSTPMRGRASASTSAGIKSNAKTTADAPFSVDDTCEVVMIRDLLRRQRELCGREAVE